MSSLFGRRAVVVGGGIGGLSAAGALAGYFEQVDVLERDCVTAAAECRPGTPQDRHPHVLLAALRHSTKCSPASSGIWPRPAPCRCG